MSDLWLSFRIRDADKRREDARRDALVANVNACSTMIWDETTSFFLMRSNMTIDSIAGYVADAVDEKQDTVVMSYLDNSAAVLVGIFKDGDLKKFLPNLRYRK